MRIALNDFVLIICKLFIRFEILRQIAAVLQLFACGPVLYPLYWAARSQLGTRSFLRYTSASLATALLHTVHGGAEPRACLTGLRV